MVSKILIVDNDRDLVVLMRVSLENQGFNCETAATGREALEKFAISHPQLVCLDIGLPDISGLEVAEKIREIDPCVPILGVTAYDQISTRVEARKSGFNAVIIKPYDEKEFLDCVERLLSGVDRGHWVSSGEWKTDAEKKAG